MGGLQCYKNVIFWLFREKRGLLAWIRLCKEINGLGILCVIDVVVLTKIYFD